MRKLTSKGNMPLSALQDAYNAMCDDLADKMHCLDVDQACHSLTNQSANIGFHAGANCIKEGIVMPDAWDGHSNYNTQRAVAEMKASTALREAINNMIEQTSNDLEAQRLRTEYAFRKRIHEVESPLLAVFTVLLIVFNISFDLVILWASSVNNKNVI